MNAKREFSKDMENDIDKVVEKFEQNFTLINSIKPDFTREDWIVSLKAQIEKAELEINRQARDNFGHVEDWMSIQYHAMERIINN